ncbi:MAG: putative quinol monooxygenase, partial [Terriglobales bacterium]
MADSQVTVIARVRAKPGQEARVREELFKLLAPTRKEQGCLNYDMHQSTTDPAHFLFHENWTSEDDLKRHFESPHLQHWLKIADNLLAEALDVSLWKRVD